MIQTCHVTNQNLKYNYKSSGSLSSLKSLIIIKDTPLYTYNIKDTLLILI